MTVGCLAPVLILPDGWERWSAAQLDAVLTHEGAHARRRDPLVQGLALLNRGDGRMIASPAVPPSTAASPAPLVQDGNTVTITRPDQPGTTAPDIGTVVLKTDGSESTITMRSEPLAQFTAVARWDGDKLIVTRDVSASNSVTQTLFLEDGKLKVVSKFTLQDAPVTMTYEKRWAGAGGPRYDTTYRNSAGKAAIALNRTSRPAKATTKNGTAGARTIPAATAIRWKGGIDTAELVAATVRPTVGCCAAT